MKITREELIDKIFKNCTDDVILFDLFGMDLRGYINQLIEQTSYSDLLDICLMSEELKNK